MPTAYLETTIISYLAAPISTQVLTAVDQQVTRDWWTLQSPSLELYISEVVLQEIARGQPEQASKRLALVQNVPILQDIELVGELTEFYLRRLGLAATALNDILHIAYAVAYELDYLVTWNLKHIANAQVRLRLARLNRELGRSTPIITTPAFFADPAESADD